jgi:hypothetical protein
LTRFGSTWAFLPEPSPRFRPGKKFENYLQNNNNNQRKSPTSTKNSSSRPQCATTTRNRIPILPVTTENAEVEIIEIFEKEKRKSLLTRDVSCSSIEERDAVCGPSPKRRAFPYHFDRL